MPRFTTSAVLILLVISISAGLVADLPAAAHGQLDQSEPLQLSPGLFIGMGPGPNFGGNVGVGGELPVHITRYIYVSASGAVGAYVAESPIDDPSRVSFDAGLKVYPFRMNIFYLGANYGIMEAVSWPAWESRSSRLEKEYGLGMLAGLQLPIVSEHVHIGGFVGKPWKDSWSYHHLYHGIMMIYRLP